MRYFIIINPPEYRDNDEDEGGFAWSGEAKDEAEAFELACLSCEEVNGWGSFHEDEDMREETRIDRDDTHTIDFGPDWEHLFKGARGALRKALAFVEGFEDDPAQEGVAELLAAMRAGLAPELPALWAGEPK